MLRRLLGIHRIGPKRIPKGKLQVLLVVLTDALTRLPIARVILPGNGSEREAAELLMPYFTNTDILLADRGYHGREMLSIIQATGCKYCLRITAGRTAMREVRSLQRRRVRDANVEITHGTHTMKVRHIRVSGGSGRPRNGATRETIYLLTNLPASWAPTRIGKLYRCRWGIETMFRELKCTLNDGPLISKSIEGVVQEIDARCLHLALAAIMDMATRYALHVLDHEGRIIDHDAQGPWGVVEHLNSGVHPASLWAEQRSFL